MKAAHLRINRGASVTWKGKNKTPPDDEDDENDDDG